MHVTYPGPVAEVELAATGQIVAVGETVDVPTPIGEQLVAQGWTPADQPAPKPGKTKTPADTSAPSKED